MTLTAPRVSIIIPHYNQIAALERCLGSLRAQTFVMDTAEIIVVDNGSAVSSVTLAPQYPDVRFLSEKEAGPGPARNQGVRNASSALLAFIDADCRAHPDWLSRAVDALEKAESTGVVGGDVQIDFVDPENLNNIEGYEAVFAYRQKMYIEKSGYSGTGNLAMTRTAFEIVGPFAAIGIAEDQDWGQRARRAGFVTQYCPAMIVYHPARSSFAELARKWDRHIDHAYAEHHGNRGGSAKWLARAGAVWLSAFPHALKLILSPRIPGFSGRLGGIATLFHIRHYRALSMARKLSGNVSKSDWAR